jgi:hypothetical protein
METTSINTSISDKLEGEVETNIAKDSCGNISEPFRELESLLLDGLQSGEAAPLTRRDLEEIKGRVLKRLHARNFK